MYEANQRRVESINEKEYKMPVLYYPQILGLAMGFPPEELGFKLNRVKPRSLLKALRERSED
jgi:heterodisulfide reductase subunit B